MNQAPLKGINGEGQRGLREQVSPFLWGNQGKLPGS